MASSHYTQYLNDIIELVIYSEGGVTISDVENMSADELPYFIYNLKKYYTDKQTQKQEFIKSIMEFAKANLEGLFKLLGGRR